jgi:co-chaperonin GroES (HSP10)
MLGTVECKGFRPILSYVLVKPEEAPKKVGNIIIPDSARDDMKPARGVVVALGPGMPMKNGNRWPMPPVKPGDTVLFRKDRGNAAPQVRIDGVVHIILHDEVLEAVIEA